MQFRAATSSARSTRGMRERIAVAEVAERGLLVQRYDARRPADGELAPTWRATRLLTPAEARARRAAAR